MPERRLHISLTVMRIAIPVTEGRLEQHFGHCRAFTLIDVDAAEKTITAATDVPAPEHVPGLLPPWLQERRVTHVIAGNMGARAKSLFAEASIEVVTGAPVKTASELARRYLDQTLVAGANTCDH